VREERGREGERGDSYTKCRGTCVGYRSRGSIRTAGHMNLTQSTSNQERDGGGSGASDLLASRLEHLDEHGQQLRRGDGGVVLDIRRVVHVVVRERACHQWPASPPVLRPGATPLPALCSAPLRRERHHAAGQRTVHRPPPACARSSAFVASGGAVESGGLSVSAPVMARDCGRCGHVSRSHACGSPVHTHAHRLGEHTVSKSEANRADSACGGRSVVATKWRRDAVVHHGGGLAGEPPRARGR
jgi:hypothetical protein